MAGRHGGRAGDHGGLERRLNMRTIATDPPVSEAQRKAMHAAAGGHSSLGISKSVGEKFAGADPGGKLPERAK